MNRKPWVHWLMSAILLGVAAVVGLLDLTMGASKDSPFFAIDDIAIRLIGAGLIISVILVLMRRRLGYKAAAICFVLSGLEVVASWVLGLEVPGMAIAAVFAVFIALAGAAAWIGRSSRARASA